jgi:hypothetical protein
LFLQTPGDGAEVPQTQACARDPEGLTARGSRESGHPRALIIRARQRRHHVFERCPLDRFPRPGHGDHQAPLSSRNVSVARPGHLPMVLRALGGIALDKDPLRPGERDTVAPQRAQQGLVRLILRMACRPQEAQGHRQAIPIPVDPQQGQAEAETPRMRRVYASFLRQRILRAPLRRVTAVTHERGGGHPGEVARWQGLPGPPRHQQMDLPIGRCEPTAHAPDRDRTWGPASAFFQGFPPRDQRLYAKEPTQDEAVATWPEAGQATQQDHDAQGQRGDRNHPIQRQTKVGVTRSQVCLSCHGTTWPLIALILKMLSPHGVIFEYSTLVSQCFTTVQIFNSF